MSAPAFSQLHTQKFRLDREGRLEVYDSRLATKINKHLKYFDKGRYVFKKGEEAVFRLHNLQVDFVIENFLSNATKHGKGGIK